MELMEPEVAVRYFGLNSIEELEELIAKTGLVHDVDDEEDLIGIDADHAAVVLFDEYEEKEGHRPDDPVMMRRAQGVLKAKETKRRKAMESRAHIIPAKVARRKRGGKKK